MLAPKKFVRVNRSAIVNVDEVREILRDGRGEGFAVLANGQRVGTSRTGWRDLLALSRR
jgi:two-component system LytT family response regulator